MTWRFETIAPWQRIHHNGPIVAAVVDGQLQVMFRTGPFGLGGAGQHPVGLVLARHVDADWIIDDVPDSTDAGPLVDVSGQDAVLDWVFLESSENGDRPRHVRSTSTGMVASDIPVVSEQRAVVGLACTWWDGALFAFYDAIEPDGQRDLWAAIGDGVQYWQKERAQAHTAGFSTGIQVTSLAWRGQISAFYLRQDAPGHARLDHVFRRAGIPGWQAHSVDGVGPLDAPTTGSVTNSLVGAIAAVGRDRQLDLFYLQYQGADRTVVDLRQASYVVDEGWAARTLTSDPLDGKPASTGITAVVHRGAPHLVWTPASRNAIAVWSVGPSIDVDGFELGAPISSASLSAVSDAGVFHVFYVSSSGQLVHAWQ